MTFTFVLYMVEDSKKTGWLSRNKEVKKFRVNSNYGWMHLIIGENKINKRKFMRLKRYMNWFSIPTPEYLIIVQKLLKKGAKELDWEYNTEKDVIITEEKGKKSKKYDLDDIKIEIPEEIMEFLHNHPKTASRLIEFVDLECLDDEDFRYLSELFKILNDKILSANLKMKISFQELLKKISKESRKNIDELTDLMDAWSLVQITSLAQIVKKRLNDIDLFENMIHDENTYEINTDNSIHRVLERSMWMLDDKFWIVQSNRSLRNFIGKEIEKKHKRKRPDFVCVTHGNNLIILEIKRPSLELKKAELDQAELYQVLINRYKNEKYNSIKVIIIGNKISNEAREISNLRRNLEIKTYQDFLEGVRARYKEYLDVVEK